MEHVYGLPHAVLVRPRLRLRLPRLQLPERSTVMSLVLFTYFLITAGIVYDVIHTPPSVGYAPTPDGKGRPQAFMEGRLNSQYIVEGLVAAFMYSLGALGFIALDYVNGKGLSKLGRQMLTAFGVGAVLISLGMTRVFIRIKMSYVAARPACLPACLPARLLTRNVLLGRSYLL